VQHAAGGNVDSKPCRPGNAGIHFAREAGVAGVNHAAVWLSAIVHFLFGAAWYTALGQAWLDGIGKSREQLMAAGGGTPTPYVVALIAALLIAYTLARVIEKFGVKSVVGGAGLGAGMAIGFIGAAYATNYAFEQAPLSLWLINTGYVTIGMALMGAIIASWRKKKQMTIPLA
jgi:hypothetical protein